MRLSFDFGLDGRTVPLSCLDDRDDFPAFAGNDCDVKILRAGSADNGIAHNGLGPADNVPDPVRLFRRLEPTDDI